MSDLVKDLKEVLDYNEETGVFTWKEYRNQMARLGEVAGYDNNGYIQIGVLGGVYMAHRLAWFYVHGEWPKEQIDHINQVKSDNRICNLREVTRFENCKNMPIRKTSASGFTGVSWSKRDKRWISHVKVNGNHIHLGSFKDKSKAISKRQMANILLGFHENHGQKGKVNV